MKEFSSVLNGSSDYWSNTFSNIGKTFCSCTRSDLVEEDMQDIEGQNKMPLESIAHARESKIINKLKINSYRERNGQRKRYSSYPGV
jgi:hypothetical protein